MANYNVLKSAIQNAVDWDNNDKQISGNDMLAILLSIVNNTVASGYLFAGVATPATDPGTPDQKVFYIAGKAGTYVNFGGTVIDEVTIFIGSGSSWTMVKTGIKLTDVRVINDDGADFDICDESGNVLVRFENGQIRTKNFDSVKIPKIESEYQNDLSLIDDNNNIIVGFKDGGIETKIFDSKPASEYLPKGTIIANEINSIDGLGEPITCLSVTDENVTTYDNVSMGFIQVLKISDSMYYMYYRAVGTSTVVPPGADYSDEKVINFAYSRNGFIWHRGFPEGIVPPVPGVNCCAFYDTDGETLLIKPSNCIFKAPWDNEYPFRAVTSEGADPARVYLFKSRDGVSFVEPKLIDPVVRDSQPSVIVRSGMLKIYERLQPSDGDRYIVVGYYDYDGNVISPFRYLFGASCYNSAACKLDERRDILFPTFYPVNAGDSFKQEILCYIVDGNIVKSVAIDSDVLTENGTYQSIYVSPNGLVSIDQELYLFYVGNDRNHRTISPLTEPYTGRNEIKMVKVTFGNNLHIRQQ